MSFGNFLKGTLAQVNPFDKGKTFGSYNQKKKKKQDEQSSPSTISVGVAKPTQQVSVESQAPKPKKTPNIFETLNDGLTLNKPNPLVSVAKSQDTKPVPTPKPGMVVAPAKPTSRISGVTTAPDQGIKVGNDTVRRTPGAEVKKADPNIVSKNTSRLKKIVAAPLLSGSRVGTGIIQGGAGLYDLATPGKGQNRVTQATTRQAEALDAKAKELGVNNAYRTINVPMEIASSLAGAPTKASKAPAIVQKITKLIGKGGRTRKIASQIAKETLDPQNIAQEARLTGRYTGQDSARGKAITPEYIAQNVATSLAGTAAPAIIRNLTRVPEPPTFSIRPPSGPMADIGNLLSDNAARDINTVNVPIRQNIPVVNQDIPQQIPIRNMNQPRPLIREFPGDASIATPDALIRQAATDARAEAMRNAAFDAAKTAPRSDSLIEGVTPRSNPTYNLDPATIEKSQNGIIDQYASFLRDIGEGNGVAITSDGRRVSNNVRPNGTSGKRMTKADWREEASRQLRSGKADSSIQRAYNDAANPEVQALLAKGDQTPMPEGRPITVKQATGIPVTDQTIVPTGLPETPGTVRVTSQSSPMVDKTQAIANAPVTVSPAQLPAETQAILDNPKQFTKRQVTSARNQRKLARAMAKTQEDTAAAMERINTVSPAAQSGEGFVPTGEFGKSVNGGAYQKTNRAAEMQQAVQETSQMSPGDVLQTARANQSQTGGFNRRDIRNVAALFETKRIPRGTPEWNEARAILKEDGTIWGQTGALRNYTMRRTASADELVNRYESKIYRLADDPTKIDSKLFDDVEAAESVYTQARDDALAAYNRFTESPTSANAKAYHMAQDAADKADKAAKTTEYKVASKVLKGNKDIKQVRELEKMASEADLYQMDAVDASMLSSTGTFVRNVMNTAVGNVEEGLFGGVSSRISRLLTGQNIGGGFGKGTMKGFRKGAVNVVDASKARANNAGKNPLEHIKNWATTGNQLGDSIIDSQVTHNVLDHYTQTLKQQGYTGRELADRASVMARQDPDNLGKMYAGAARTAAGLGGGITRNNKIETIVKNMISDGISMGKPTALSEATAKMITRMTIGFPTAIGRSTVEGVKRFTLGAPTFIKAFKSNDPVERALLVKEGLKQAGTGGMVIPPLFYAMGASGMITGSYPQDPEERARWTREGITENSIKIDGNYYQLPSYLGAWAVPGLFYASLGRNDGDFAGAAADTAKIIPSLLPTDQMTNVTDVINGRTPAGKFMAQSAASAVRAATPGGAILNQVAKSFDPTKNDTSSGTDIENFVNKVLSGIPGVNNISNIPDKTDDAGNPIANPGALPLLFGASSASQDKGTERSNQIQAQTDSTLQQMSSVGALNDPNLAAILDDKEKLIYQRLSSGEQLGAADVKKLQEALVKGVSSTGDDTAYLEREQYDTNLSVLKLKKQLMEADKTVKPSDIKKVDMSIKRGEIYKSAQVPYDLISSYQDVGIDDWRKMGDPEDDNYDPEMYQRLWDIDQAMAKSGVSYKKGAPDKNKYYVKQSKASGTGKSSSYSSDFGTLKASNFAPSVKSYDTIDQKSGGVPIIKVARPNIVHRIGTG